MSEANKRQSTSRSARPQWPQPTQSAARRRGSHAGADRRILDRRQPLPEEALAAGLVNIEIDAGQNENPFRWNADALKSKFGVDIKMIGLPFVGQYEKLVSELTARSSAYDLLVFPPYFLGDFVALGFLKELDPYFGLLDPQLADYMPAYRDPVIKRNGKTYALMYDGDMLQVTYRTDLFNDPTEQKNFKAKYGWDLAPATDWDQFMQIAEFFTRPPNLYGTAFYAARGFCYGWFANIFAGLGGRWFSDDMKPGINSDAGVKALEMLVKMKDYSVPNILQIDYPALERGVPQRLHRHGRAMERPRPQGGQSEDEQGCRQGQLRALSQALPTALQPRHGGLGFSPRIRRTPIGSPPTCSCPTSRSHTSTIRNAARILTGWSSAEARGGDEEPHRRTGARRGRRPSPTSTRSARG